MFVENRGKTEFWIEVARGLVSAGHKVGWILQNPAYAPPRDVGEQFFLEFPKNSDLVHAPVPEPVSTDRGRHYFGAGSLHYAFYSKRIAEALDYFQPDAVLGEPTLMHELLAVAECRRRGIPYLHPTMSRYPSGRFNVLDGDTQLPVLGSGETWSSARLDELAVAIGDARSLPSYMTKPSLSASWMRKLRHRVGQVRTLLGWLRGERFNTPSPVCKAKMQRQLKENLAYWEAQALMPDIDGPVVLYPLQMQPEANIDVWGRPYCDQAALVKRLLSALPSDGAVVVKANPKSKYEVSEEMLAMAANDPRLILLPLNCSMQDAQKIAIGAVTVSGTVGLEAVFGRGRCLSLRHPVLQKHLPEFHSDSPEMAVKSLLTDPAAGCGSPVQGAVLLAQLVADSFEGTINEPTYDPDCLSSDNIGKVTSALLEVLGALQKKREHIHENSRHRSSTYGFEQATR